jgi:hypothetical protein
MLTITQVTALAPAHSVRIPDKLVSACRTMQIAGLFANGLRLNDREAVLSGATRAQLSGLRTSPSREAKARLLDRHGELPDLAAATIVIAAATIATIAIATIAIATIAIAIATATVSPHRAAASFETFENRSLRHNGWTEGRGIRQLI